MGFLHPEMLLLALPVGWCLFRWRSSSAGVLLMRGLLCAALVLALASPYLETSESGRDLVFVVDRSQSMPPGSDARARELIELAEEERRAGDRVGVVSFGADVGIERPPMKEGRFQGFARVISSEGSNLGSALETALQLIPPERRGSIVVLSDGESQGRDPVDVARRARARDARIDVRALERRGASDLAVARLDMPDEVAAGEPFQLSAWVHADERVEAEFVFERAGEVLARGTRVFEPGANRMLFRDRLDGAGVGEYRLRLFPTEPDGAEGSPRSVSDRFPENNVGVGAVRAVGARGVLVLNDDGREGVLAAMLRAARIPVQVARPEDAPLSRVGLTAYRAVVLENVAAGRFGARGLEALRDFVLERGGGLLMTGGRASFSLGGYYLSALDPVLPVSLEMRQERRKQGVAISVVMDRSGSMSVEAAPGVTKMDLANLGTAAAIELLSPLDSIGVIAVDSSHHVIQRLTTVDDVPKLVSRVRRIRSQGGGIFVYTGLKAAAKMLQDAPQRNRHVILFSDAADSEEQDGCVELIEQLAQRNTSLSVIALGSEQDPDAGFLKSIAAAGGGEVYFTTDPNELPRLFAQDTMVVARATWIEAPTPTRALPDLFGLGEVLANVSAAPSPTIEGYNLTYLRSGATAGMVTTDEYRAPLLAFHYAGLGRAAAYTGQVGGTFGGAILGWPSASALFVTLARFLVGQEEPAHFFTSARLEGREAVVRVDVDAAGGAAPDSASLRARITSPTGSVEELVLERVGEQRFEARYPIDGAGVALGTVELGEGRHVALPPIALPYSPEFEKSTDPHRGARLLGRVASESGGRLDPSVAELLRGERGSASWRLITRELLWLVVFLLLLEIAVRRLELLARPLRELGAWFALTRAAIAGRWAGRVDSPAPLRRAARPTPAAEGPPASDGTPVAAPTAAVSSETGESVSEADPRAQESQGDQRLTSALERARRAARRKLQS